MTTTNIQPPAYWTTAIPRGDGGRRLVATRENPWASAAAIGGYAHGTARVSPWAWLGPGSEVGPDGWVEDGATVGPGVYVPAGAYVGEGAEILAARDVMTITGVGPEGTWVYLWRMPDGTGGVQVAHDWSGTIDELVAAIADDDRPGGVSWPGGAADVPQWEAVIELLRRSEARFTAPKEGR